MKSTIVIICGSDVCTAPTSAVLLSRRLKALGLHDQILVTTAGVFPAPEQAWCTAATAALRGGPDAEEMRKHHRTPQISAEIVREADLILTTERRLRRVPRELVTAASVYTFTLVEAAALGRAVLDSMGLAQSTRPTPRVTVTDGPVPTGLPWLVTEMEAMRGLVQFPPDGGHGWRNRLPRTRPGIDIPDPHGDDPVSHRRAATRAAKAVNQLAAQIARLNGSRPQQQA